MQETQTKSLHTLELAKSRVKIVTRNAGLRDSFDAGSNSAHANSAMSEAESALSKQVAVAQNVQKQAEQALNNLQRQRNQGKGQGNGYGSPPKGKGQHQYQQSQGAKRKATQNQNSKVFNGKRRKGGGKY